MNPQEFNLAQDPEGSRWPDHPCFNPQARKTSARIHLAVAPRCNVQCRFCDRQFSCVNESRPGVTAQVLTPEDALAHLELQIALNPRIKVVGIAGPGDPFANPWETLETLRRVREAHPQLLLCLSTNGLGILPHINEIKRLEVSHVTITVNGVHPRIIGEVYDWIYWEGSLRTGKEAASILWENQSMAIQALAFRDITVKINSVLIPGVNDTHMGDIARETQALGASVHNIIPLIPVANTAFADKPKPSPETVRRCRSEARVHLPQMEHCARCRSDAVGFLGGDCSGHGPEACGQKKQPHGNTVPRFPFPHQLLGDLPPLRRDRPFFAVATREGVFINSHLGEASSLAIFRPGAGKPDFVENRLTPPPGGGSARWLALAELLKDCSHLFVSGIGPIPRTILSMNGITPLITSGFIQEAQHLLRVPPLEKNPDFSCGEYCGGTSHGCDQESDHERLE